MDFPVVREEVLKDGSVLAAGAYGGVGYNSTAALSSSSFQKEADSTLTEGSFVEAGDMDEHVNNSQDAREDVDLDELSYEELLALGEVVGIESRGLPTDTIAYFPSIKYKTRSDQHGSNDSCVICLVGWTMRTGSP